MQNRQFNTEDLPDRCPYQQHHALIVECALDRPAKVGKEFSLFPLFQAMRIRVPVDGMKYGRVTAVATGPGLDASAIESDVHSEHLLLYYVEPSSPIVIDGVTFMPVPGQFLYVAPGVKHHVIASHVRRVVLAMLVV